MPNTAHGLSEREFQQLQEKLADKSDAEIVMMLMCSQKLVENDEASSYCIGFQTLLIGEVFARFVPAAVFDEALAMYEEPVDA